MEFSPIAFNRGEQPKPDPDQKNTILHYEHESGRTVQTRPPQTGRTGQTRTANRGEHLQSDQPSGRFAKPIRGEQVFPPPRQENYKLWPMCNTMLNFLRSIFSGFENTSTTFEGYWLATPIKLPTAVRTPGGGRVTVISACIDIVFSIPGDTVILHSASLSSGGGFLGSHPVNVSGHRTGEAWYQRSLGISNYYLLEAAKADLSDPKCSLEKCLRGRRSGVTTGRTHKAGNRFDLAIEIVYALNDQMSAEEIQEILDSGSVHSHIEFSYSKPNERSKRRRVVVHGTKGKCIRATDKSDDRCKLFRIDRISIARVDAT